MEPSQPSQSSHLSRQQRFTIGFCAGLIAGLIASGFMLLLSVTLGGISLPEVFGSALTQLMPPTLFDFLHRIIGGDAKHYLFYGIFVGQCFVFAVCGGLYNLIPGLTRFTQDHESGQSRWFDGNVLALFLWVMTGLVFLPLTGGGIFGASLAIGLVATMLSLGVVAVVFGLLFVGIQNWLILRERQQQGTATVEEIEEAGTSRRSVLKRTVAIVGIGTLGVLAWRFISSASSNIATSGASVVKLVNQYKNKITPPPVPNYGTLQTVANLSPEITSNDQFYIVSKNLFSDPTVDGKSWSLKVHGLVEQPYTLTYNDLLAMPTQPQYESMMCISNEVGGSYMSNAKWDGIPLQDLLTRAKIKPGATKVVFSAVDDYSDSIHLIKALEPTTMLATHMNGQTLPQGHGFPARMLVPGIYGMKHVKWIKDIEVVATDYQGYWQTRGWSDPAPVRLTSRIDTPLAGTTLAAHKPTYIAGVAFSGNKGISQVDVSLDNGSTWQKAILKQPLSQLTWVLWELPWTPSTGSHTILVRAIDMEGNIQDPAQEPSAPNGSAGYHTITVTIPS